MIGPMYWTSIKFYSVADEVPHMSIIFGVQRVEGGVATEQQLLNLARGTDKYAPDGTFVRAGGSVGMGFQPCHTHRRSSLESRPAIDQRRNMLALDGRIDNFAELCELLGLEDSKTADSQVVLAAFERWGEYCFARLVGDWSLALWSHLDRTLYLARDHAGARTLYFEEANDCILWSTYLETFFVETSHRDEDEGFAASYLTRQPIGNRTPYKGLMAVPPAHYLKFHNGSLTRGTHWRWFAKEKIHYQSDVEYEEHFVSLFRQSVARRTGPGAPILAELSGGMDSSSIVCVSDRMRVENGAAPEELLDTVSYYDESEPNWNELPYFTAVEDERKKSGVHVRASFLDHSLEAPGSGYLLPGADSNTPLIEQRLENEVGPNRYRVILSGLGGDELLGGPPNPLPELADYLVSGQLGPLFRQAIQWCLSEKIHLAGLLWEATKFTVDVYSRRPGSETAPPPWIPAHLCSFLSNSEDPGCRSGRFSPSSIDTGLTWWTLLETLPHRFPRLNVRYEYRYPFLDRDLVDFLLRLPCDQLRRAGQGRFLMRRALRGIVPRAILERKRKAYPMRGPSLFISENREKIAALIDHSQLGRLGYINEGTLRSLLYRLDSRLFSDWRNQLMNAIQFELWLRCRPVMANAQEACARL